MAAPIPFSPLDFFFSFILENRLLQVAVNMVAWSAKVASKWPTIALYWKSFSDHNPVPREAGQEPPTCVWEVNVEYHFSIQMHMQEHPAGMCVCV